MPLPLRGVAWVLVGVQLVLPFSPVVLTAMAAGGVPAAGSVFAVPPSAPSVVVNRLVPLVAAATTSIQFSVNPTDEEISRVRVFGQPLVAAGQAAAAVENRDLAVALVAFREREDADDGSALENFLQQHPDSPRRLSLLGNLANHYRHTSQFSKALAGWQQVKVTGEIFAGIQSIDSNQFHAVIRFNDNAGHTAV